MTAHYRIPFRSFMASVFAVSCLHASAVQAQSVDMTPELKKVVEAAKKEGMVSIMMSRNPAHGTAGIKAAEAGINKMFGTNIKVRWTPGPSYARMGAKLLTEYQANQPASTDVYVSTAVQLNPLSKKGLFSKFDWLKLYPARLRPFMVEADGTALRNYTALPSVVYNKRFEAQVKKTRSLEDFLKPEWKGKFVTTPYLAAFDVLISKEVWGLDKTRQFVLAMSANIGGMLGCGAPDRIASGEMPVLVLDCDGGKPNVAKYKPILGNHILHETAQRRFGYLSIPKNARHPNAGALYMLYYASPEGQRTMWKNSGYDMSDYPESNNRRRIAELEKEGYKFIDVTVDWWAKQKGITKAHRSLVKLLRSKAKKK